MSANHEHAGLHILGKAATGETTTEAEVSEIMQRGVDKNGKKISLGMMEVFNEKSSKDLSDLVDELNEGELRVYVGPDTQRVCHERYTVKVVYIDPVRLRYAAELLHVYRGDKFFVFIPDDFTEENLPKYTKKTNDSYSFSESVIEGETDKETCERCLRQEAHLEPSQYEIVRVVRYGMGRTGRENFHESKTYAYSYSKEYITSVFYIHSTAFDPDKPVPMFPDTGKKHSLRVWRPYYPIEADKTIAQLREEGHDI